jgi:hypothetical protein
MRGQPEIARRDEHCHPRLPVRDAELQAAEFGRERWVEPQDAGRGLDPGVTAQQEIGAARHGAEVDALPGGAALDVAEVGVERVGRGSRPSRTRRGFRIPRTG